MQQGEGGLSRAEWTDFEASWKLCWNTVTHEGMILIKFKFLSSMKWTKTLLHLCNKLCNSLIRHLCFVSYATCLLCNKCEISDDKDNLIKVYIWQLYLLHVSLTKSFWTVHFLTLCKCGQIRSRLIKADNLLWASNAVYLNMLPCFVPEQDGCQLGARWMSRSSRKWAPVRWTRSDRAPPHNKMSALCWLSLLLKHSGQNRWLKV